MTATLYSFSTKQPIASVRQVPITNLGEYRASLRYDDLRTMLVRALSAATLGKDPALTARAIAFMRHVAEFSDDFPQARSLAREYLGYVGKKGSVS